MMAGTRKHSREWMFTRARVKRSCFSLRLDWGGWAICVGGLVFRFACLVAR